MKQIIRLVLIKIIIVFSLLSSVYAWYNVNSTVKNRIDGVMTVVEKEWWVMSTISQINKYQKIINTFSKVNLSGEWKEMIWYLLYLFEEKVEELEEGIVTQDELITNVDRDRVQETWLEWHNAERRSLWLDEYKLNESLNFSSLEWAQHVAKLNNTTDRINHKRLPNDPYYSYYSILNWFNGLWISFDYNWTAFTENIAYQYYSCNKSDCTNEIISALKKWFNFFMSEKWENYKPHYQAITHPVYDEIGVWVALVGKRYWVVSHYGVNVE
jgi:hypothetical protein